MQKKYCYQDEQQAWTSCRSLFGTLVCWIITFHYDVIFDAKPIAMYITNTNTQRQRHQNNLNLGPLRHQKPMMSRWLHLFRVNARVPTFTLHQKRTRPSFIFQVVCTKTIVLNALLEAMVCTIFTVELMDFNNTFPDCPYIGLWRQLDFFGLTAVQLFMPPRFLCMWIVHAWNFLHLWRQKLNHRRIEQCS